MKHMNPHLAVSFVHGYSDLEFNSYQEQLPALWVHGSDGSVVYQYPFPRNVSDFELHKNLVSGEMPLPHTPDFKKLPRFGLTGLRNVGDYLYAGSWNGVYEISKSDFTLNRIISNRLMNDMHDIWVDDEYIVTVLTGKDTVVLSDFNGNVVNHFSIANDLSVVKNTEIEHIDWRFLSKQSRGATGLWHFNYVQRFDKEIWLTSRNLNAVIVINYHTKKAHLRTMNHKTTVCLHDGTLHGGQYYFTSIDGKIIIATEASKSKFNPREQCEDVKLFTRDMLCELIRLEETEFGRQPNWCRGIACHGDIMYVTVDGRYDTDLSFGVLGLKRTGEMTMQSRLRWKDVGSEKDLRYVTGFDVVTI